MPLFFLPPGAIRGDLLSITGSLVRHIGGALRYRVGDRLTVVDHLGERYRVELTATSASAIDGIVRQRLGYVPLPALHVTLVQAMLKRPNMDTVIEKATELGVQRVIPLITRRTVVRPRSERASHQLARWQAIALEAAQQSERGTVPEVEAPRTVGAYCAESSSSGEVRLMLWEDEPAQGFRDYLDAQSPPPRVTLLIGPEGGFDPDEVRTAHAAGFVTVSLGDLVLRAETAGPVALTILQSRWGDLGRAPRNRTR
jgi:16S rRNA (uracil1498-N3)-methyltransferase